MMREGKWFLLAVAVCGLSLVLAGTLLRYRWAVTEDRHVLRLDRWTGRAELVYEPEPLFEFHSAEEQPRQ